MKRRRSRAQMSAGAAGILLVLGMSGCVRVQTEPIRIEPITIEVTVNHRIQEELDSYFGEIDRMSETVEADEAADNAEK